jgi:hypothetical protein
MGGSYHPIIVQLAAAGLAGFFAVLGAIAWQGAGCCTSGSVMSVRLAALLPGWGMLSVATAGWFGLSERLEPAHASGGLGLFFTVGCLLAVAWALLFAARAAIRVLADAVIAAFTVPFAEHGFRSHRLLAVPVRARRSPLLRRRFARPPPVANDRA